MHCVLVEQVGMDAPQSTAFDKTSCSTCKTTFDTRDEQVKRAPCTSAKVMLLPLASVGCIAYSVIYSCTLTKWQH